MAEIDAAKAKVSMPQVIAIVAGVLSFFAYQFAQFDSVKDKIGDVKAEVSTVANRVGRVEEILSDRITRTEFVQWTQLLAARNAALNVPDVRH